MGVTKTGVVEKDVPNPPGILNNTPLYVFEKFCYLGSTVSVNAYLDEKINIRICKAASTFGRLSKRAVNDCKLTTNT